MLFDLDIVGVPLINCKSMRAFTHLIYIWTSDLLKKPLLHFRIKHILDRVEGLIHYSVKMMPSVKFSLFIQRVSSCVLQWASSIVLHVPIWSMCKLFWRIAFKQRAFHWSSRIIHTLVHSILKLCSIQRQLFCWVVVFIWSVLWNVMLHLSFDWVLMNAMRVNRSILSSSFLWWCSSRFLLLIVDVDLIPHLLQSWRILI